MNRVRITAFTLVCALLLGTAQASFFLGVPLATELKGQNSTAYLGLQVGTYDLGSGFRLRGRLEVLPPLGRERGMQLGGELLYSRGESSVFYLGAGGGYAAYNSAKSLFVSGTVGLNIDAASLVSVFLEAQPRYDLDRETIGLYLSGGLNFHFGQ